MRNGRLRELSRTGRLREPSGNVETSELDFVVFPPPFEPDCFFFLPQANKVVASWFRGYRATAELQEKAAKMEAAVLQAEEATRR